ncbi:MAG: hypothetical protein NC123_01910 [Butyrivibrio sp.]|nr:hypothetical protein [Acetatifactor muris]MCM1558294.1 hypothetical protein [Butyrivibrio sp.]
MDLYSLGSYYQNMTTGGLSGSYLSGLAAGGGLSGSYLSGLAAGGGLSGSYLSGLAAGSGLSGSYLTGMLAGGLGALSPLAPVYAKFTDALQKTLSERQTFQQGRDVVLSFPPAADVDYKADVSKERADMSSEEYKKYICGKISALPVSASCRANCSGVLVLKEEAFVNMQKDPAYEKEVLNGLQKDFQAQYSCYAPKFGFRVIGGSAGESYGEGMTPVGSSTASGTSGAEKSRLEERQEQIDLQIQAQLGRRGSLTDRLASNRAARLQERMTRRQEEA